MRLAVCLITLLIATSLGAHTLESNTSLMQIRRSQGAAVVVDVTREADYLTPAKLTVLDVVLNGAEQTPKVGDELEVDGIYAGQLDGWRLRKGVSLVFLDGWESDGKVAWAPVLGAYLGDPVASETYQRLHTIRFLDTGTKYVEAMLGHLEINPHLNADFTHPEIKARAQAITAKTPRMLLGDERIAVWKHWLEGDNGILALDALVGAYEIAELLMPYNAADRTQVRALSEATLQALQELATLGLRKDNPWLHSAALGLGERVGFLPSAQAPLLAIAKQGVAKTLRVVWLEAHRSLIGMSNADDASRSTIIRAFGDRTITQNELETLSTTLRDLWRRAPDSLLRYSTLAKSQQAEADNVWLAGAGYTVVLIAQHRQAEEEAATRELSIPERLDASLATDGVLAKELSEAWLEENKGGDLLTSDAGLAALKALLPQAFDTRAKAWQEVAEVKLPEGLGGDLLGLLLKSGAQAATERLLQRMKSAEAADQKLLLARILAAYGAKLSAPAVLPSADDWELQLWYLSLSGRIAGESSEQAKEAFVAKLDLREILSARQDRSEVLTLGDLGRITLPKLSAMLESEGKFSAIVIQRATFWLNQRSGLWMGFAPDILEDPKSVEELQKRWKTWLEGLKARDWDASAKRFTGK